MRCSKNRRHLFGGAGNLDGGQPMTGLTHGANGIFYGTTYAGGTAEECFFDAGCGVVFELSPEGSGIYAESVIYDFGPAPTNASPIPSGVIALNGDLYGTTYWGGSCEYQFPQGCGALFSAGESTAQLTVIHSFEGPPHDGALPGGAVRETSKRIARFSAKRSPALRYLADLQSTIADTPTVTTHVLYGNTSEGGSGGLGRSGVCSSVGCGTVYSVTVTSPLRRNPRARKSPT
ncbi:MAG: choice-of-anchor tandem repeat GloVer-containing protein [Candidatus Cybelea sp.]